MRSHLGGLYLSHTSAIPQPYLSYTSAIPQLTPLHACHDTYKIAMPKLQTREPHRREVQLDRDRSEILGETEGERGERV